VCTREQSVGRRTVVSLQTQDMGLGEGLLAMSAHDDDLVDGEDERGEGASLGEGEEELALGGAAMYSSSELLLELRLLDFLELERGLETGIHPSSSCCCCC